MGIGEVGDTMEAAAGGGGGMPSDAIAQAGADVGKAATAGMVAERNVAVGQQAAQMSGAAGQLKAAAAGGGFKLEPEAADTLIKACQDSLHDLIHIDRQLQQLRQAPKLGETPGAKIVAPFTQQVATGGDGGTGMEQMIGNLRSTLQQMVAAYQAAKRNYQENEQQIAQSMRNQQA